MHIYMLFGSRVHVKVIHKSHVFVLAYSQEPQNISVSFKYSDY